jgi:hypothetical protein
MTLLGDQGVDTEAAGAFSAWYNRQHYQIYQSDQMNVMLAKLFDSLRNRYP